MTDQSDYRTYLELHFKTIHETLDRIEKQTLATNGRITEVEVNVDELEKKVDEAVKYGNHIIDTRATNCPNIKRFEALEGRMETLHKQLEDAMFFIRHPKVFIGSIVVLVIAAIATIVKEYILK
jgi:hypothetical protein